MLHTASKFDDRQPEQDLSLAPEEAWPFYSEDEIAAAVACLRSGKVNQWTGTQVASFQDEYARLLASGRSIALANGSVALELALRAFGIGPGDEVIVSPRSFVASAFCVSLVGATPVFVDVDGDSGNITAETIAGAITPKTRAVIPVHLGGWPCDMPAIMKLAREHGILVIEDCAQAHGAEIGGKPVGSFGDAAAFSFCQDKIITTGGEGGLVHFQNDNAFEWAWSFKDHGKNRLKTIEKPATPGFRWLHDSVGTNWRMLEMSAAIGRVQLEKLNQWRALRTRNANIWIEALAAIPGLRIPLPASPLTGAFYKLYVFVDHASGADEELRNRMLAAAAAQGIRLFSGSCSEIYLEAAFAENETPRLATAKKLGETSLMLEVHPTLDEERLRARAAALAALMESLLG